MHRTVYYFIFLILLCGFFSGCANTIKGLSEGISKDIKSSWSTLKKWDANFKKNWW